MSKRDLGRLESEIAVNRTSTYIAPEDADTNGIPNILDDMNAGLVSIWQLDVVQPADTVVAASSPVSITTVADNTIQFIK